MERTMKMIFERLLLVMVLLVGGFTCASLLRAQIDKRPAVAAQLGDDHEGQPDMCSNAKNAIAAHKCDCMKSPSEEGGMGCDTEDKKCKVYCRKDHCHCFHPACDS